jgi:N,N'-diacetyllegionaminate synthase
MVEIIAEIAQGYEGSGKLSELLTKGAIGSNADSIKFQLVYADELATPDYEYYGLFKSLEMDLKVWSDIVVRIHENGKKVYFDVFGDKSLSAAKDLGVDGVKLSTTEFYNKSLIKLAIKKFEKILISIGGIPIEDIDELVENTICDNVNKCCLMYGFQSEPTPLSQNNLNKISSYKKKYPDFQIGFMDHSAGDEEDSFYLPLMALALGVDCIEKHITLDRILKIEDYISALEPNRFREFVRLVRKFETAIGSDKLELTDLEKAYRKKAAKVVVANRNLAEGQMIKLEDICLKRVGQNQKGTGFNRINDVLGKLVKIRIRKNTLISTESL